MKKLLVVMLTLVMALCLVGCNKEEEAVNKTVVIYTSQSEGLNEAAKEGFEKATGYEVEYVQFSSQEGFAKIQAEKDDPQCDVFWCGGRAEICSAPELFEPYESKERAYFEQFGLNEEQMISHPMSSNTSILLVNTKLLAEHNITVEGYADLLNPELKGHIAMGNALASNSAYYHVENMLQAFSSDPQNPDTMLVNNTAGWDFLKAFYANLDGKIIDSSSAVAKGVASGEYWVACTYDVAALQVIQNGATDVKCVCMKEGVVQKAGGPGIIKNCKNLEGAKAWIDWMQSKEAQNEYLCKVSGFMSTRNDVDVPDYNNFGLATAKQLPCSTIWTSEHKQGIVTQFQKMLEDMNFGA